MPMWWVEYRAPANGWAFISVSKSKDQLSGAVRHGGEERRRRVLAVAVRAGAAAHAVEVGADVADELAVLGDPAEQERVDLVEPGRDHRPVLLRAGVLHLGEHRLAHPEGLEGALQALAEWRVQARVDAAALVGQYLHRVHHADPPGQVRPEEAEQRLAQAALGGAEGRVERAVEELRRGAPPVDGHLVAPHGDRARVLQQDVLAQGG